MIHACTCMPVGYMRICVRVYDACVYVFACMVHACTRMYDVCVCMVHACTCMCTCFYVYTCVVPVCGIHVYMRVHVSVYDTYSVHLHMHETCMYMYGTCPAMVIGSV